MAIDQAIEMKGGESLKGLIHHSDRGVQYCCDAYVQKLQEYDISISMTEDYKPTDNAIAERVNGIIKMERSIACMCSRTSNVLVLPSVVIYNSIITADHT